MYQYHPLHTHDSPHLVTIKSTSPKTMSGQYTIPKKKNPNVVNWKKGKESSSSSSSSSSYTSSNTSTSYKRNSTSSEESLPGKKRYNRSSTSSEESLPGKKRYNRSSTSSEESLPDKKRYNRGPTYQEESIVERTRDRDASINKTRYLPLLVYCPGRTYDIPDFIVLDHPIFDGVQGHFQYMDFEKFYTDEMHHEVVEYMSKNYPDYETSFCRIDRVHMEDWDIEFTKNITLREFLWKNPSKREPITGESYRGTLMVTSIS